MGSKHKSRRSNLKVGNRVFCIKDSRHVKRGMRGTVKKRINRKNEVRVKWEGLSRESNMPRTSLSRTNPNTTLTSLRRSGHNTERMHGVHDQLEFIRRTFSVIGESRSKKSWKLEDSNRLRYAEDNTALT